MLLPISFERALPVPAAVVLGELSRPGVWRSSALSPELRESGIFEFEVRPGRAGVRFLLLEGGRWSPPFLRARVTASGDGTRIQVCIRRSMSVLIAPAFIAGLCIYTYRPGNPLTWEDLAFGAFIAYGTSLFFRVDAYDMRLVHFLMNELERRLSAAAAVTNPTT